MMPPSCGPIFECSYTPRNGDDDDSTWDDDDDVAPDDDDSAWHDDDDVGGDDDSMGSDAWLRLAALVWLSLPLGDDDDTGWDDDDAALDDDDAVPDSWPVTVLFMARFSGEQVDCEAQALIDGVLHTGPEASPGDCLDCEHRLLLDPSTTTLADGGCGAQGIDVAQLHRLLIPRDDGGQGDLLDVALMSAGTLAELELALDVEGSLDAEELIDQLDATGVGLTHVGFVEAAEGSLLAEHTSTLAFAPPQPDSLRVGLWTFGYDLGEPAPGEHGYPDTLLGFGLGALWLE